MSLLGAGPIAAEGATAAIGYPPPVRRQRQMRGRRAGGGRRALLDAHAADADAPNQPGCNRDPPRATVGEGRAADQEEVGHPRTHAPARTHPHPPARALSRPGCRCWSMDAPPPRPALLLLLHPSLPLLLTSRLPPLTPLCSSSPPFLSPASSPFSPLSTPACPTLLRAAGRCTTPPDTGGCSAARCSAVRLCVAR